MYLDGWVIDFGERRERQIGETNNAHDQIATMRSDVATGRRTKRLDGFMIYPEKTTTFA